MFCFVIVPMVPHTKNISPPREITQSLTPELLAAVFLSLRPLEKRLILHKIPALVLRDSPLLI